MAHSFAADTIAPMPDDIFVEIAELARTEAGLMIPDHKRPLIQSRLTRHLRQLGLTDFHAYLDHLKTSPDGADLGVMIATLTTNVSDFFREKHHYKMFAETLLPQLLQRAQEGDSVRIWSAGCSSGQEPYSVAMMILDEAPNALSLDLKILATDIDRPVLAKAREGTYDRDQLNRVPRPWVERFFTPKEGDEKAFEVSQDLRDLITFNCLNLIDPWPMQSQFDVIFCRNVVIYFTPDVQTSLFPRLRKALTLGGTLFLGHSERIADPDKVYFRPSGVTAYTAI
ncbi:MAG: protein-glutamate O-methyltransferase [Pseudomonadota bacterium]